MEDHINDELKEINESRTSIWKIVIRVRVNSVKKKRYALGGNSSNGLWFKKTTLTAEQEKQVVFCIAELCSLEFSP